MKKGISFYIFQNENHQINFLEKIISEDENVVLFNLPIKCTFDHNTYFKNKKIAKMKGLYKVLAKIFYRFVSDVEVKIELETYSESSNKKFMCIKDFIEERDKMYVIGTMGFGYRTMEHILNYLLLNKKDYKVLVVDIAESLKQNRFYENLIIGDVEKIMSKIYL